MGNNFIKITALEALEELVTKSENQPVVIFKHSLTCPVSSAAYSSMSSFGGEVVLVEVQRAPELSRAIERRTGLRHESPQVIILRKGKAVWNASHWRVKADAVSEAAKQHA